MKTTHHVAVNTDGLLNLYKRRKIDCLTENGRQLSDAEARQYLYDCKAKGWKLIPCCSEEDCPNFDPFGGGCPGHPRERRYV